jgi:hypothetical protein
MNHHKNGTISVGAPNSYRNLLSGLEDLMKGKPKSFEVFHFCAKIKKAGQLAGLSIEQMQEDVNPIL